MPGPRSDSPVPGRSPGRRATAATAGCAAVLLVLALTGCSSSRHRRVVPPAASGAGGVLEGLASWYGEPYHGRQTASGERYDMWQMTAAHRTLPFGTRLEVTNLDNGRSAEVVVNDRGPFVAGRILDLSRAAADKLDAVRAGVIPVRARVIAEGDGMVDAPCWEVQVGAFARRENAERAKARLEERGLAVRFAPAGGGLTRVRVSGVGGRPAALELARSLGADFPGAVALPCGGGW